MNFITAHTPEFSAGVIILGIAIALLDLFVVSGLNRARRGFRRAEAHYDKLADEWRNAKPEESKATFTTRRQQRNGRFVPVASDAS